MSLTLYSYFRSSSSYRVRIALNLKGLAYETKVVNLVKGGGEQYQAPLSQLNPSHRIPVLLHGDKVIAQSVAIIEYLDEVYPAKNLYPHDPYRRAQVRQLCEIINSDIQPLQNLSVLKKLAGDHNFTDEQKLGWIKYWITLGFSSFEQQLIKTNTHSFCLGDTPTAADCFLIPQIYNAHRYGVDFSPFPLISKIAKYCSALEAFIQAHPDHQPDTPKE